MIQPTLSETAPLRWYQRLPLPALALCMTGTLALQAGCARCGGDDDSPPSGEAHAPESPEAREPVVAPENMPVATINGRTVLTVAELRQRVDEVVARYEALPDRPPTTPRWRNDRRRILVQEAIADQLVALVVRERNITVTDAEIEARLLSELGAIFEEERIFQQYLDAQQTTREELFERKRRELAEERLLEERGDLNPSDEEIERFYQDNMRRWNEGERVLASVISTRFRRDAPEEFIEQARQELLGLRARILAGDASFEDIAAEHSQTAERRRRGDMGWIVRGRRAQLAQDGVEDVLFTAPLDTVTEPLRTALGWQVFWIRDRRPAGLRDLDEVRPSLVEPLRRQKRRQARTALVQEMQQRYEVRLFEDRWALEDEEASTPAAHRPAGTPPSVDPATEGAQGADPAPTERAPTADDD